MPQLDKLTYFSQFFWLCILLFTFYILLFNNNNGILGISRIIKLRNQLLSHRGNKIRSEDPKNLEDISRKGFSTGLSYMYSSLSEVSQWCKTVDYLGKRKKINSQILRCYLEVILCPPVPQLFFRLVLYLSFTFVLTYTLGGGVAMAANPPAASASFVESSGDLNALLETPSQSAYSQNSDTSASVNQEELEQELRARQAKLREIEELILQRYRAYVVRRYPWMQNSSLLPDMRGGAVEGIVIELELDALSSIELTECANTLRANPQQLNYFFKDMVVPRK